MTNAHVAMLALRRDWEGDETIEQAICRVYNCRFAEIDGDGDVWIDGPQRGHWLDADALGDLPRMLIEAGTV